MEKKQGGTKKKNTGWNKFFIILTMIFTLDYLIWRIFFTIPKEEGIVSIVFWAILLLAECVGLLEMAVHFYNMYDYDRIKLHPPYMKKEDFPEVDIFIPTINEEVPLLEKTLISCKQMEYPDPNKVHIYLCDDGNRQEVKELAERLYINYITREEHKDAKAGNLNHALQLSHSPYIAVFDADMMPKKKFLMKTIPWFGKERTGFVQTPQNFCYPDLFQYNLYAADHIPNEQDYFYKVVQVAKNKSNSVIFGGSNAVLSRKALEETGGFVTGVVTEDFATGIEIEKKGYKGIAIPEVLASGMPPMTFKELVGQRRRWAKGCIQSGKKTHFLFSKKLTFLQKLNYLTAISYWYTPVKRLIYFMAPLLFAFFGIMIVKCRLYQVFLFWLPMYISGNICMRRFSRNIRTTKWTDIYETTLAPWLLPTVLAAGIGKTESLFRVTDKSTETENNSAFRYTIPYLCGITLSIIGIVRLVGLSGREQTFTYCVILFWLFLNLYFMVMALYIAAGRKIKTDYQIQNISAGAIFTLKAEMQTEIKAEAKFKAEMRTETKAEAKFKAEMRKESKVQSYTKRYTAQCKGFSDHFVLVEIPLLKDSDIKDTKERKENTGKELKKREDGKKESERKEVTVRKAGREESKGINRGEIAENSLLKGIIFLKETEITLCLKRGLLQNSDNRQYLFEIDWTNIDTDTRCCYMNFLYNRASVLPQELKRNGIFDECITALISRLTNE